MPGNNSSAMASIISNWSLERWFDVASTNLFQLAMIIQESPDTESFLSVSRTGQNWILSFSVVWFEV